jgi:hypothetical protein
MSWLLMMNMMVDLCALIYTGKVCPWHSSRDRMLSMTSLRSPYSASPTMSRQGAVCLWTKLIRRKDHREPNSRLHL